MKQETDPVRIEDLLNTYFDDLPQFDAQVAREIVTTALKLGSEQVSRLDRKIVNSVLKELRYAFRVFAPYKGIRKVTIFGSARIERGDPAYIAARDFSRAMAQRGWMVITGAGPGIMEAGHEGAGGDLSFGVNILLPFEAKPNPVIANDSKLINFKYFFTRKLTFMKEADAFVLLPGGFGTLDEAFELLTLVQTGKSDLHPIVMLDQPGGDYWRHLNVFIDELAARRYISEHDKNLYRVTDDIDEAVAEIENFHLVYHSQRIVGRELVVRLNVKPSDEILAQLSEEFEDILTAPMKIVEASAAERRDNDVPDLPRVALAYDFMHTGRLRRLIDRFNETCGQEAISSPAKGDPSEL